MPRDGESLLDMLGPDAAAFIEQAAQAYGDGWRIPHDPPDAPRRTPHPLKTGQQPVSLTNPAAAALPRTFIYCTQDKDAMGPVGLAHNPGRRAPRSDSRWRYRELQTGRSPWETAPRELASLLLEVV